MSNANVCTRCGHADGKHAWIEGDCILPHSQHSRATIGHCCRWCIDRHKEWLTEIVELYADLATVVALGSVAEDEYEHQKPRKKPASPALMRLEAWAMTHDTGRLFARGEKRQDGTFTVGYLHGLPDVWSVIDSWTETVIDSLNWTSKTPGTVSGCAALLTAQADHIATQPFVDDYDAELRWLRASLMRAHGLTDPQPLGECLSVGCGGIVWPDDAKVAVCRSCGRVYGTASALARLAVQEDKRRKDA